MSAYSYEGSTIEGELREPESRPVPLMKYQKKLKDKPNQVQQGQSNYLLSALLQQGQCPLHVRLNHDEHNWIAYVNRDD